MVSGSGRAPGLIARSGQWWKVYAGIGFAVVCAVMVFVAVRQGLSPTVSENADTWFMVRVIATIAGLVGAAVLLGWVRCPQCGSRWVWSALRTQPLDNWLPWIMTLERCPKCGYSHAEEHGRPRSERQAG